MILYYRVFQGCVYIDDILVTGGTEEEHLARLSEVLNCHVEAGMRLMKDKCAFLLPSLEYLGHVICIEGLKTSDSNVKAVTNACTPTNVRGKILFRIGQLL